jgi:predicted NUDIX family NTP pyrophosphohydrolase
MPQVTAGIALYRDGPAAGREVLLVHPGGPYWAKRDVAAWSIPKGLVGAGEDLEAAARREFAEEVGTAPAGPLVPLAELRLSGSKRLVAFALQGDFDPSSLVSNSFELEWPPRSGLIRSFPEVDRARWFSLDEARTYLHLGQRPLVQALQDHVPR